MQNVKIENEDNKIITNKNNSKWKKETQELIEQYNLDNECPNANAVLKQRLQEKNSNFSKNHRPVRKKNH